MIARRGASSSVLLFPVPAPQNRFHGVEMVVEEEEEESSRIF